MIRITEDLFKCIYELSRLNEETGDKYFNVYLRPNIENDENYNIFIRVGGTHHNDASFIDKARDDRAGERFTDQQYREDPVTHQTVGKTDYFEGGTLKDFKNEYERISSNYRDSTDNVKIKKRVDALHDFFERYCDYVEKRKEEGMTNYPD